MELTAVLAIIKHLPEGLSALVICSVIFFTFLHKRKDAETANIISISTMQNNQLSELLKQNRELGDELHATRKELKEAYEVIADMRKRLSTLEVLLNSQHREVRKDDGSFNCDNR